MKKKVKRALELLVALVLGIAIGIAISNISHEAPSRPSMSKTAHGSWITSDDGGNYIITAKGYGVLYSNTAFSNKISATQKPVVVRSAGYTIEVSITGGSKTETYSMQAGDSKLVSCSPYAYLHVTVT